MDIPIKVGRSSDNLYVQSFLADQKAGLDDMIATLEILQKAQKNKAVDIDYARLREAMETNNGRVITLVPNAQPATPASQRLKWPKSFLNEIAL